MRHPLHLRLVYRLLREGSKDGFGSGLSLGLGV